MTQAQTPAQSGRIAQYSGTNAVVLPLYTESGLPEVAYQGQLVIDSDNATLRYFDDDGAWQDVQGGNGTRIYTGSDAPSTYGLLNGDQWFNTTNSAWYTWDAAASQWVAGRGTSVTASDPSGGQGAAANLTVGTIWVDNSGDPPQVKYWTGDHWAQVGDTGAPAISSGPTMPATANTGDLWMDTATTPWVNYHAVSGYASGAGTMLDWAPTTTTGPAITYGTTMPDSANAGDLWYQSSPTAGMVARYVCVSGYTSNGEMSDWALADQVAINELDTASASLQAGAAVLTQVSTSNALGESLAYNNAFALGGTGWEVGSVNPADAPNDAYATVLFESDGAHAQTGSSYASITPDGTHSAYGYLRQSTAFAIPITGDASESYYTSVPFSWSGSAGSQAAVNVGYYDASGTFLSSAQIGQVTLPNTGATTLLTGTFVPPAAARSMRIGIVVGNGSATLGPYYVGYVNIKRAITADMLSANLVISHEIEQLTTTAGVTSGVDIKNGIITSMSNITTPAKGAVSIDPVNGMRLFDPNGMATFSLNMAGDVYITDDDDDGNTFTLSGGKVTSTNHSGSVVLDPSVGLTISGPSGPAFQAGLDGSLELTQSKSGAILSWVGGVLSAVASGGSTASGAQKNAIIIDPTQGMLAYGPGIGTGASWKPVLASSILTNGSAYFAGAQVESSRFSTTPDASGYQVFIGADSDWGVSAGINLTTGYASEVEPAKVILTTDGDGNNALLYLGSPISSANPASQIEGSSIQLDSTGNATIWAAGAAGELDIYSNGATYLSAGGNMTLEADGSAGLSISGSVAVRATGTTGGYLTLTNYLNGGTTTASLNNSGTIVRTSSSQDYKAFITDAELDSETLLSLTPREFTWHDSMEYPDGTRDVGFIAEEAAEVGGLEYWVVRTTGGKPASFRYDRWVVALQAIARAQADQIADLTTRIANLEATLSSKEA